MNRHAHHGRPLDGPQLLALGLLLAAATVLFVQQRLLDDERAAHLAREQACHACSSPLPE
jgi:hypothetical protein